MEEVMERPSHIAFDNHPSLSRRVPSIGLAICLQLAGLWLFSHGLASGVMNVFHPIDFVFVHEKQTEQLAPPPEPPMTTAKVPIVPVPDFGIAQGGTDTSITEQTVPLSTGPTPASQGATRAPIGIAATHTVPPYPPIARRLGAEGKVSLRLTISPEGRVSSADVVSSSGREDLDEAARQWILAHWTYKPELKNGLAEIGHVMASVTFSLTNAR
jgi:periplasmic protein TonB